MTRWTWSYLYWGVGWLLIGFLAGELAGYFDVAPWTTLSETVWHSIRYPIVGPAVFATLIFLGVHFLYHRAIWQGVLFGVVVAGLAHWLDGRL